MPKEVYKGRKLDEMSQQLTWKERTCNWQTFNSRETTEVHLCLDLCEVKDWARMVTQLVTLWVLLAF